MGVALLEPGRSDPHKLALLLQLGHRARTDVEHRLVQAADELVGDCRERAAIGDLAFDAFMADRENRLLTLIVAATGHHIDRTAPAPEEGQDVPQSDDGILLEDIDPTEEEAA